MEKMTLERFREIKGKFKIIELFANEEIDDESREQLDGEKTEELEQEMGLLLEELHQSDLSDIPAEEYEGFYDIGVDFSGTKANIDFKIIATKYRGYPIRVKGCNVTNFDFDSGIPYDEESFDEEFVQENRSKFWGLSDDRPIPREIRDKYHQSKLTLVDIIEYNLFDIVDSSRIYGYEERHIFEKLPESVIRHMDIEFHKKISYSFIQITKGKQIETIEDYDQLLLESVKHYIERCLSEENYDEFIGFEKARELVPEYIIDFPEGSDELKKAFLQYELRFEDILEHQELFRGKKFVKRMAGIGNRAEELEFTEEKIFYMLDNYPELSRNVIEDSYIFDRLAIVVDPSKTKEENTAVIREEAKKIVESPYVSEREVYSLRSIYGLADRMQDLSEYDRQKFDQILKYATIEEIESYRIPREILSNSESLKAFAFFGLKTIMDFDRENGEIFSRENYNLLKSLFENYLHYDHSNMLTRMDCRKMQEGEPYDRPFTKEEFEEAVIRMIRRQSREEREIDFRVFSDGFKKRHSKMYLPEDADEELKQKYYNKQLTLEDFVQHPEWISQLKNTDFSFGIHFTTIRTPDGLPITIMLGNKIGSVEGIQFLLENKRYIDFFGGLKGNYARGSISVDEVDTVSELPEKLKKGLMEKVFERGRGLTEEEKMLYIDEMVTYDPEYISTIGLSPIGLKPGNVTKESIRESIESRIVSYMKNGTIGYSPEKYPEFAKKRNPELFLDDDAPIALQQKFYTTGTLYGIDIAYSGIEIGDLVNPEYRRFLEGKTIISKSRDLARMENLFSIEDIIEMAEIDLEAINIYASNELNAKKLKTALSIYPEKFAREDIMKSFNISKEELDERLANDPEVKTAYEDAKNKYRRDVISMPGLILDGPEELSRIDFRNYRSLVEISALKKSPDFRRDIHERIVIHAYEFLGYDEARKLLAPPEISPENVDEIYEIDGRIKDLYEKKFELSGNVKVLYTLLLGIPSVLPESEKTTSKNTLNIYKAINKAMTEGYQGDIRALLSYVLNQNGMPEDQEKIEALASKVISMHTEMKLSKIREFSSAQVEGNIAENAKTRKKIKEIYREALKYSLNKSEKVDPKLVREYLERELSRLNEDGEYHYSPHVRDHLEEIVTFSEEINNDPEKSKEMNQTIVDSIKDESTKIGRGWIRKILGTSEYPKKMTYEQAVSLDQMLYGEDSEFESEMIETVGVRELSDEDKKKLFAVLGEGRYAKLLTFNKAELMFSGLVPPYSEEFRRFFLEHKDEFIEIPDFYSNFTKMHAKFDVIISDPNIQTRYKEGLFTVINLLREVQTIRYDGIEEGLYEWDYIARKGNLSQEQFDIGKRLIKEMQKREYSTVPPEEYRGARYRGRIVRIDDPLHFAIGEITNCCQTIGESDPGESSMIHSATEKNGALFVVEELDGDGKPIRIVAQSWTWRNGNRIVFDNVEIPTTVREEMIRIGGFDEVMEVYEGAAQRIIETDRRYLRRLLELGKITEEQYRELIVKDVTMGKGCDDLIRNLSSGVRRKHPEVASIRPLELGKTYEGATQKGLYVDSRETILITHNDEFDKDDHKHVAFEVKDVGIRYTKIREIFRRRGGEIDPDKIAIINEMVKRNGRSEDTIFGEKIVSIQNIIDEIDYYGDITDPDDYGISMSENGDWFILSEEREDVVMIHDSGIDQSREESDDRSKIDKKMAIAEYQRELLMIIERANKVGKKVIIDSAREGKFISFDKLIENGEIEVSDRGIITVLDADKLRQRVESLSEIIEQDRRDRIVSDAGLVSDEAGDDHEEENEK